MGASKSWVRTFYFSFPTALRTETPNSYRRFRSEFKVSGTFSDGQDSDDQPEKCSGNAEVIH